MINEVTSFSRTMRALDADGMSPTLLAVILVAGLGGVWSTWLVTARVPVYQISEAARLEVERVHPVAATAAGRVVATSLVMGRDVRQGDVLLEVEADRQRLETGEERTRLTALAGEAEALQREIHAEEEGVDQSSRAARAAVKEAGERLAAADAAARQAQEKLNRTLQLEREGLISHSDADAARSEAVARAAELAAAHAGIDRLRGDLEAAERDRRGRIASLMRERVGLEGLRATTTSTVTRREREAELRRVRAPMSGRLGEVNPIQVGAVINEGERLASIIPAGQVRGVAEFSPPALGRVRPGQRARVRLDGFPWTQYGHVDATVTSVAGETREQRVRVELAVRRTADSPIPLEHGMPGVVEVEVERVAPIALLLRSLGQMLSGTPGDGPDAVAPAEARSR
jgi:multidrug resistance efflux pump